MVPKLLPIVFINLSLTGLTILRNLKLTARLINLMRNGMVQSAL